MADRASFPPMRAPLQESRSQNTNIQRQQQQLLQHANVKNLSHTGILHKPGQGNTITKTAVPSAIPPVKHITTGPIVPNDSKDKDKDKDGQRTRIVLQQKPFLNHNTLQGIDQRTVHQAVPIPLHKIRQSAPPAKPELSSRRGKTDATPTQISQDGTQQQPQTASSIIYGSQEWNQKVVSLLDQKRFYFDCVDPNTTARLTKTLKVYNASVTKFFSNDVTHIITTNPIPKKDLVPRNKVSGDKHASTLSPSPIVSGKFSVPPPAPNAETNILVKAMGFGIQVVSLEKFLHLLRPVMVEPIAPTEDRKLQDLLHREKVFGLTTAQNDDLHRSEYHILKGNYVLIEDTTGYYQTILAHEYPPETRRGIPPWPKIYVQATTKSPYVHVESRSKHLKQPPAALDNKDEDAKVAKPGQGLPQESSVKCDVKEAAPMIVSGIIDSTVSNVISTSNVVSTSNAVSTNSAIGKPTGVHVLQNTPDRVIEQLGKRVLNSTKGQAGIVPEMKQQQFVNPADVVRTAKSSSHRALLSRKQEPLAAIDTNTLISRLPTQSPSTAQPAQQPLIPAFKTPQHVTEENGSQTKPVTEVAPATAVVPRKGFCENCRGFYNDIDKHIYSREHRQYAHDQSKFAQLDTLLARLQRRPKDLLRPSQSESTADSAAQDAQQSPSESNLPAVHVESEVPIDGSQNSSRKVDQTEPEISKESHAADDKNHMDMRQALLLQTDKSTAQGTASGDANAESCRGVKTPLDDKTKKRKERVILDLPILSDEIGEEPASQIDDEDEVSNQLSSELSRLDVAEIDGEEERPADVQDQEPAVPSRVSPVPTMLSLADDHHLNMAPPSSKNTWDQANSALYSRPEAQFSDRLYVSENNMTSQIPTDATQPDERFLDYSVADSQFTDPVPPIRLELPLTSVCTDGPDVLNISDGPYVPEIRNPRGNGSFLKEGSSESGCEDDVALLKSPSAGRGVFIGGQDRRPLNLPISSSYEGQNSPVPTKGFKGGMSPTNFKRKLESVMAEERAAKATGSDLSNTLGSSSISRSEQHSMSQVAFNDILRSRLLTPSDHQQQSLQRPVAWVHASPHEYSMALSQATSSGSISSQAQLEPIQHVLQTTPPFHRHGQDITYNTRSSTPAHPHDVSNYEKLVAQQQYQRQQQYKAHKGAPSANGHIRSDNGHQQLHHPDYRSQFILPPFQHQHQHQQRVVSVGLEHADSHSGSVVRMGSVGSTSITSPLPYEHSSKSRSPLLSTYSGYGSDYSSPTRSPSQRRIYRTEFATMSHAEQERERCYEHYQGNQLPEPAGQKKVRSNTAFEEELQEYGEDYIEA
ncbi:hypothetical protein BGZ51_009544 [Haplosporangium sp. Z 767]|nr:hypothetical protein BGZ50_007327 [Haplosporangium sp. Z 11]KAF9194464.1 hypothetical protein BGZ51_009544 [Haplosporangium sp. Z 767]